MSGLTPESSAIRMSAELEAKVAAASTAEEIKALMAQAALEQHLVERDVMNSSHLIPTALADHAPRSFAKVIVINGVKHVLEAPDELGLAQAETNLMRKLFSQPEETEETEQRRDASGRFVSQNDIEAEQQRLVESAELEGRFKRGEISTETYLIESGALDRALTQRQQESESFQSNWETGTQKFVARHPEWVGGDANRDTLGQIIVEHGMVDMNPLDALEKAYAIAQEENRLVENPAVTQWNAINEAQTPEQLRAALGIDRSYGVGRDIWGR